MKNDKEFKEHHKYTDISYYRDEGGKWWILVNGQGNLPVKKETSELMEIAYQAKSMSKVRGGKQMTDKLLSTEEAIEIIEKWQAGNFATRIDDMNPALNLAVKVLRQKAQLAKVDRQEILTEDEVTEIWWSVKESNKETPADIPYDFAKDITARVAPVRLDRPDVEEALRQRDEQWKEEAKHLFDKGYQKCFEDNQGFAEEAKNRQSKRIQADLKPLMAEALDTGDWSFVQQYVQALKGETE